MPTSVAKKGRNMHEHADEATYRKSIKNRLRKCVTTAQWQSTTVNKSFISRPACRRDLPSFGSSDLFYRHRIRGRETHTSKDIIIIIRIIIVIITIIYTHMIDHMWVHGMHIDWFALFASGFASGLCKWFRTVTFGNGAQGKRQKPRTSHHGPWNWMLRRFIVYYFARLQAPSVSRTIFACCRCRHVKKGYFYVLLNSLFQWFQWFLNLKKSKK